MPPDASSLLVPDYRTKELPLAAFLVTKGYELRGLLSGQPGQRIFVFGDEVLPDAQAYFRNAPVPARAYAASLRDLKQLLHSDLSTTERRKDDTNAAVGDAVRNSR